MGEDFQTETGLEIIALLLDEGGLDLSKVLLSRRQEVYSKSFVPLLRTDTWCIGRASYL